MRLVVQIPCLNEEDTLPLVLESIPKEIPGIDDIIVLIVDDGCSDRTVEVARSYGVTEFVHHARNQGLGRSFRDGVVRALELGADIVVNTDGDNQYPQDRITDLVQPIVRGEADIVIADRQVHKVDHFSPLKKQLQKVGSGVVNRAAGTKLPDAASGFRAYSRESLMVLNTITRFSYCMETIIQAGNKNMKIASIPVETNAKTRESRLFKSMPEHIAKSAAAIIRSFMMYRPYVIFAWLTMFFGVLGMIPFVRYAVLMVTDSASGHIQSLLLGSLLMILAFMSLMLGIIADLIRTNRILIEDNLEHTKKARFGKSGTELLRDQTSQPHFDWPREHPGLPTRPVS
ncbi:glycosyltransferase family 2 protein [Nocardioides cavernaquae]|uniref:Glycosyltransferase family 2 protein n=1 Tax=Nocardioides cavernaquae TaxID=2321396 RepID=A0A3A5H2D5_9ACTN|nr:glycosyltransferase family 2 protein [Nocardioides cavernaquae]RJS44969.1 glycosyltransferase family 2 protein [Nocardioides cavernaquae]